MKNQILVVDGKPQEFERLKSGLAAVGEGWDLQFCDSAKKALDHLSQNPCDVVVSDGQVSDMNGEQLLEAVKADYPGTLRMLLSQVVEKDVDPMSGLIHQFVSRQCSSDDFRLAIDRASKLHSLVQDPELSRLVSQIQSLPSLPSLYMQIVEEMQSEDPSIRRVGEIVSMDVAMTAKVLQIANSAAFGVRVRLSDPIQATIYLGLDMIKGLVLTVKVFSRFKESMLSVFPFKKLWDHSFRVGNCARVIAKMEGLERKSIDDAFTAGLLHDIGQLIFSSNLAEKYCDVHTRATEDEIPLWQLEMESFGATHSQIGAYLVGLWGLDDIIFDVLLYHHTPDVHPEEEFSALSAVHVANFFDHIPRGRSLDSVDCEALRAYLDQLNMADRLEEWLDSCLALEDDFGD